RGRGDHPGPAGPVEEVDELLRKLRRVEAEDDLRDAFQHPSLGSAATTTSESVGEGRGEGGGTPVVRPVGGGAGRSTAATLARAARTSNRPTGRFCTPGPRTDPSRCR